MASPITLESIVDNLRIPILEVTYGSVSFGREPENTIVIDNSAVSRTHGVLLEAGSQWVYYDNESTNFSWINSLKLNPYELKIVRVGDILKIANFEVGFSPSSQAPVGTMPTSVPSALVFFKDRFKFEFSFSDPSRPFKVGGLDAELLVDGEPPSTNQFRVEAASTGSLKFQTLDASTPIHINGNQVGQGGQSSDFLLRDSDLIQVGAYRILICRPSQADLSTYQQITSAPSASINISSPPAEANEPVSQVTPITIQTSPSSSTTDAISEVPLASSISEGSSSDSSNINEDVKNSPIYSLQTSNPSEQSPSNSGLKSAGENLPMDVFHQISPGVPPSPSDPAPSHVQTDSAFPPNNSLPLGEGQEAPIYSQENLPEHLRERAGTGSWLSESAKRKKRSSQSFVFTRSESEAPKPNNSNSNSNLQVAGISSGVGLSNKPSEHTSINRSISPDDLSGMGADPRRIPNRTASVPKRSKANVGSSFISKLIYALAPFILILSVGIYFWFLK